MSEFLIISDWGHVFTRLGSFFSNFFWNMNTPLGVKMIEWTDDFSFFDTLPFTLIFSFLNRFTVLEFVIGFGLSFIAVSHMIKLLRESYLF